MLRVCVYALSASVIALGIVSVGTVEDTHASLRSAAKSMSVAAPKGDKTPSAERSVAGPTEAAKSGDGVIDPVDDATTIVPKTVQPAHQPKGSSKSKGAAPGAADERAPAGKQAPARDDARTLLDACESALGPLATEADLRRPDLCLA